MPKYRKKPIVIDAFQYDGDFCGQLNRGEAPEWASEAFAEGVIHHGDWRDFPDELFIITPEGDQHISTGDYIVRGVTGEVYPCKPAVFERTYEVAE